MTFFPNLYSANSSGRHFFPVTFCPVPLFPTPILNSFKNLMGTAISKAYTVTVSSICPQSNQFTQDCKKTIWLKASKSTWVWRYPTKISPNYWSRCTLSSHHVANKQKYSELQISAEILPIFKKGNTHDKKNYRPASILPCFSKIFEGILIDQMYNFMSPLLSLFLSGFGKGHNCQNVLQRLIDRCKFNIDMTVVSVEPYRLIFRKLLTLCHIPCWWRSYIHTDSIPMHAC